MSNLLQTEEGRAALYEARNFLLRRRLSRFFKRNLVIDYDRYSHGTQEFDLETLLGELNAANDDEILDLYRLLGTIGGLEQSLSDVTIYVDADNGDDQTGTGSTDRPFASLWFVPFLPRKINHFYRIILMTDIDMSGDNGSYLDFDQNIGMSGCLTLAGYGPEDHVLSGLDATCSTQTPFLSTEYSGLVPPPTSAVLGNFVQVVTGGSPGDTKTVQYQQATANGELVSSSFPNILVNDTIRYIRPARLLRVRGLNIRLNMADDAQDTTLDIGSRFGILNLRIEAFQGTEANRGAIFVDSVGSIVMSFAVITGDPTASPGSVLGYTEWRKGNLNWQNLQDVNVYDEIGLVDITNLKNRSGAFDCAGVIFRHPSALTASVFQVSGAYGNRMHRFTALGTIRLTHANGLYDNISSYNGISAEHCDLDINNSLVGGNDNNGIYAADCRIRSFELAFHQCGIALSLSASSVLTNGFGIEATYGKIGVAAYHLQAANSSILNMVQAWSGLASTAADCRLIDSNPDVTGAFPGAGAQLTDGLQTAVVRPG